MCAGRYTAFVLVGASDFALWAMMEGSRLTSWDRSGLIRRTTGLHCSECLFPLIDDTLERLRSGGKSMPGNTVQHWAWARDILLIQLCP
jgi:hypothetical protein